MGTSAKLAPRLDDLSSVYSHSIEVQAAIESGIFYVVATSYHSGLCIGTLENNVPALLPTREEAEADLVDWYNWQKGAVANNERTDEDIMHAELLKAKWDGGDSISLYVLDCKICDDDSLLFKDSVANLTGG